MWNDPIVEEVYSWRQEILDEYGGDLDKWIEHLKAQEAKHEERLVTLEQLRERRRFLEAEVRETPDTPGLANDSTYADDPPWRDPIVEEVRQARREILARFGGDMEKYMEHLQAREAKRKRP